MDGKTIVALEKLRAVTKAEQRVTELQDDLWKHILEIPTQDQDDYFETADKIIKSVSRRRRR